MSNLTRFIRRHFLLATFACAVLLAVGWFGIRAGIALYEVNETFNITLARDVKTDAYLGEVLSENKNSQTGKVERYRIKRNDGSIIERSADSVLVFKP
jgi:hypothetical protein